jgi:aspartyl protease family protein
MDEHEHKPDFSQRIGKSFVLLAWLVGLALLSWLFADLEQTEKNPNQSVQTHITADGQRAVTLTRNRFGHYVSNGKINGRKVTFLLDTGASDVSIPESLAYELDLERGPEQRYQTANGLITGYLTRIDRISIGDIELYDVRASINPNSTDDDILLGMSFLNQLEYTQQGNQLILRAYRTE